MKHGSLFSGIGGFDLAANWMGWENLFHCEINPFGQKVLKYYWPNAELFENIITTDFTKYANRIDILTGGFPCQPYSVAGKRKGTEDERHLWPEMLRAIHEIKPTWVVGENVSGIISWDAGLVFEQVQIDLEAEGYQVQPFILPACGVGAPHRRDRVWFVAYNHEFRKQSRGADSDLKNENKKVRNSIFEQTDRPCSEQPTSNTYNNGSYGSENRQSMGKRNDCHKTRQNETCESERCPVQDDGFDSDPTNPRVEGLQSERENGVCEFKPFADPNKLNGDLSGFCSSKLSQLEKAGILKNNDANASSARWEKLFSSNFSNQKRHITGSNIEDWTNWPTQPPVCSGNDGLPPPLVGITISKHRCESIKGYGNAIVPQVVLQIFKAIQEYENTII